MTTSGVRIRFNDPSILDGLLTITCYRGPDQALAIQAALDAGEFTTSAYVDSEVPL